MIWILITIHYIKITTIEYIDFFFNIIYKSIKLFQEKYTNLHSIFNDNTIVDNINLKLDPINFYINSPLEPGDLYLIEHKNQIFNLLNYIIMLDLIILYLIFLILLLFTINLIANNNINLINYPLGNSLNKIYLFLIKKYKLHNSFWIYFFLICIFIFTLANCYGIYALTYLFEPTI